MGFTSHTDLVTCHVLTTLIVHIESTGRGIPVITNRQTVIVTRLALMGHLITVATVLRAGNLPPTGHHHGRPNDAIAASQLTVQTTRTRSTELPRNRPRMRDARLSDAPATRRGKNVQIRPTESGKARRCCLMWIVPGGTPLAVTVTPGLLRCPETHAKSSEMSQLCLRRSSLA
jgi:hypothetical protein